MTYNISNTQNSANYTVTDGFVNSGDLDIGLVGKGVVTYGSTLNTNFLRLLENFSNSTAPTRPIQGQLWYKTTEQTLYVFSGTDFVSLNPAVRTSQTIGNLIIQTSSITGQVTNGNVGISAQGSGYVNIARLGITGTTVGRVLYTAANGAVVTNAMQYNSTSDTLTVTNLNATQVAGTLTTAAQTAITSVGTLTGLAVSGTANFGTTVTAATVSATTIGNSATALSGTSLTVAGTITAATVNALNIGNTGATLTGATLTGTHNGPLNGPFNGTVGASTANTGAFTTITATSNVVVGATSVRNPDSGARVLNIDGPNARLNVSASSDTNLVYLAQVNSDAYLYERAAGSIFFGTGNTKRVTLDSGGNLFPAVNGTQDLGSTSYRWNTVWGKASSATYADLAEMYEADKSYSPGTVVEFGGEFEITEAKLTSKRVAGVISTNPGYLMNSEAKGNFMLPVALQGRVPCKVIGPVYKGDMLVSAGDGHAIVSEDPKIGTVIGKALENMLGGSGVIEVVVGRC